MVYGRNIYQHANPKAVVNALMAIIHRRRRRRRGLGRLQPVAEGARYLLGLDAGNTVIKAVLFDRRRPADRRSRHRRRDPQARARAWSSARWPNCGTMPAWRSPAAWRRPAVDPGSTSPRSACAGHGNGLYLLDRDGGPLIGIQSLDTRAAGAGGGARRGMRAAMHAICLQRPWPSQTPVLLAWLKRQPARLLRPRRHAALRQGRSDLPPDRQARQRHFRHVGRRASALAGQPSTMRDLLSLYGLEDAEPCCRPCTSRPAWWAPSRSRGRRDRACRGHAGRRRLFRRRRLGARLGRGRRRARRRSSPAAGRSTRCFRTRRCATIASSWSPPAAKASSLNMENSATSAANLEWYVRTLVERGGHHDDPFGFVNDAGRRAPRRRMTIRSSTRSSMAVGWARTSAAASSAWPAGTTRGTCCARCSRA